MAGRVNISEELAAGLTFAYNAMNNTTGINIKGGTWNVKDFGANSANNNYALAVGAGVGFSKEGLALNGAVGLNLGTNSTKSILDDLTMNGIKTLKVTATDNTSKTTVAGNVNISKDGTVALGGSGGKSKISASGSTSLNYINNSAKTLVENANVKADKNFGVVAQSDEKIANYAGAVDVDVNGSIGVSVAYNEIKGNTDALVKNSKLEVGGSTAKDDLIAISNPKDNLIDDFVTKNNWTSGRLMSGRKSDKKSGLVVNSSATHSISSDLATIGIRASSDSPGVGVSGAVNINKIGGATTSRIQDSEVGIQDSANPRHLTSDTYVNAADFTNNGSFIGNAAVSGTVAVGVLWNENKIERETNSLVKGGTLNVKNLDVKADSRQGLSNLNIAVGAGFAANKSQVFAAASGDNIVRNQMEGTTTAKIENATVNHSGNVNVDAYHKDDIYATNIGIGAAIDTGSVGATFDLGYGLTRENSTVEAEINNSTLKSKVGAVNVNAEKQLNKRFLLR